MPKRKVVPPAKGTAQQYAQLLVNAMELIDVAGYEFGVREEQAEEFSLTPEAQAKETQRCAYGYKERVRQVLQRLDVTLHEVDETPWKQ